MALVILKDECWVSTCMHVYIKTQGFFARNYHISILYSTFEFIKVSYEMLRDKWDEGKLFEKERRYLWSRNNLSSSA